MPAYSINQSNNVYQDKVMNEIVEIDQQKKRVTMMEYFRHTCVAIRCENIRKCIQKVNEQLLKHVIAHELAHYKRKDTIWNMVGSLYFHLMIELFVCTLRLVFNRKEAADKVYIETVNGMTSFIGVFCKMNTLRNK